MEILKDKKTKKNLILREIFFTLFYGLNLYFVYLMLDTLKPTFIVGLVLYTSLISMIILAVDKTFTELSKNRMILIRLGVLGFAAVLFLLSSNFGINLL